MFAFSSASKEFSTAFVTSPLCDIAYTDSFSSLFVIKSPLYIIYPIRIMIPQNILVFVLKPSSGVWFTISSANALFFSIITTIAVTIAILVKSINISFNTLIIVVNIKVKIIFLACGSIILNIIVIKNPVIKYIPNNNIPIVKNVSGTLSFSIFVIFKLKSEFLKSELLLLATSGSKKNSL